MKIVTRRDLSKIAMVGKGEKKIGSVILDGDVMTWVGIGWVNEGPATAQQKQSLPKVVD